MRGEKVQMNLYYTEEVNDQSDGDGDGDGDYDGAYDCEIDGQGR